jgi:hypothetical protein
MVDTPSCKRSFSLKPFYSTRKGNGFIFYDIARKYRDRNAENEGHFSQIIN